MAGRLWGGTWHMGTATPDPSSLNEVRPAGGSSQAGGALDPRDQETGPESSQTPRPVWSEHPSSHPRGRRAPSPPGEGALKQGLRRGAAQNGRQAAEGRLRSWGSGPRGQAGRAAGVSHGSEASLWREGTPQTEAHHVPLRRVSLRQMHL